MTYTNEGFAEKVREYTAQPHPRSGFGWPKDPLEKWILGWLQLKAEHGYRWSEWSVASEAAQAAKEFYAEELEQAWMYRDLTK